MNCLIDYIGLLGETERDSGLLLNDLPGISIAQLEAITDPQHADFTEMWDSVQRRAAAMFTTDFRNAMSVKYELKTITKAVKLSETVDTSSLTAAANEKRGILIEIGIRKSPFHFIPLANVRVYLVADSAFVLKVYDVSDDTLTELDSFSVNGLEGWNTVKVNKSYPDSQSLFIAYDATAIDSPALDIDSCVDCSGFYWSDMTIRGVKHDGVFTKGDNTYGMTATLSLQCSFDALVCNLKPLFGVAFWYLLGAEVMKERIYSDRINRYTTVDLARAKDLEAEFRGSYMVELKTAVQGINLKTDWCIECGGQVTRVECLP